MQVCELMRCLKFVRKLIRPRVVTRRRRSPDLPLFTQPPWLLRPYRLSLIVEALARLRCRSCIIDGEAVVCDERGVAQFDRIRYAAP